jgi:hypothetical protein
MTEIKAGQIWQDGGGYFFICRVYGQNLGATVVDVLFIDDEDEFQCSSYTVNERDTLISDVE